MQKRIIDAFIDFANEHPNDEWVKLIQEPPYNIEVRQKDRYYLFKYNQLESDMSLPLCQACRGLIVEKGLSGQWGIVCYPFDKFFNYGEPNAAEIDWYSAFVNEKIDGSLIKFWHNYDGWHLSTNNSIDAFEAPVSNSIEGLTFGNLVERALGCNWLSFCRELDEHYTYMFELVSPESQVTIHYDHTTLYYLGQRNNILYGEYYEFNPVWREFGVEQPKRFYLSSLNECIEVAEQMTKDEEGMVVADMYYNRIKIKSPQYLIAAHATNNDKLGLRTAVRLIREDKVDDFLAYAPIHRAKMELIIAAYEDIKDHFWEQFCEVRHLCWMPRKNYVYALNLAGLTKDGFNFSIWAYDHRENNINDYMNILTEKTIMLRIKERIKKEMEVEDDE